MKIKYLVHVSALLMLTSGLVLLMPAAQGHPCNRDPVPEHKHCASEPPSSERIPGSAVFQGTGPILGDGGIYEDGEITSNHQDNPANMQVAMNCSFNHFNVYPGGGSRRIFVNFSGASPSLVTGINSCKDGAGDPLTITVDDTTMADDEGSCVPSNSGLDWAFDQLMRAEPSDGKNVCDLGDGESSVATLRFQTNLYHVRNCKGGKKKCGTSLEALEVNYDGSSCDGNSSDVVTVTCDSHDGDQCTAWTVQSTGMGCVTSDTQGSQLMSLPFEVTFTPTP